MALFEMLYESMKVLEVDTATCVIAALEDEVTDRLATGIRGGKRS
jgi:hypothetical protein